MKKHPSIARRDARAGGSSSFLPTVPSPPQSPTQLPSPTYAAGLPPPPHDRHMRRGQDEYEFALAALLPMGIAWPRELGTTLMSTVRGLAGIFGWCDGRAADLLERESDPRQTVEMLDSWETAFGLPDPCWYPKQWTVGERQMHLVQRMTTLGAQSREFFVSVANYMGYTLLGQEEDKGIREYRPFMVGMDRVGDNRAYHTDGTLGLWPAQLMPPTGRFVWTVRVGLVRLTWFRASKGQAGTDAHLRIAHAEDLECVIRRWSPAHTIVLFDYSGVLPYGDPYAGTEEVADGAQPPWLYVTTPPLYTPPPYYEPIQP